MKNKTRRQLIIEEKYKLMKIAVKDGFYLFEVGKIFKVSESRMSQILKSDEAGHKEK